MNQRGKAMPFPFSCCGGGTFLLYWGEKGRDPMLYDCHMHMVLDGVDWKAAIHRHDNAIQEDYIRTIPNFPEEGIMFRDVTTVLQDAEGYHLAIDEMQKLLADTEFDVIVGAESRGFIFGAPLAYNMKKAFVPVRKKGKLPCETIEATYDLEYGTATIEMHKDSILPGQRVVIVDDLIATGGTIEAAAKLVEELGGKVVKIVFLLELAGLEGRERLSKYEVETVVTYPGK